MSEAYSLGDSTGNEAGTYDLLDSPSKKNLVVHADEAAFVKNSNPTDVASCALKTLSDSFKGHLDQAMAEMKEQNKRDTESILAVMKEESAKRTNLEQRLHSQLLLQAEYMTAMELKLLRLEAKVERREAAIRQQHQQQNPQQQRSYSYSSNRLPSTFTTINESALEMPLTASHENTSRNVASVETPPQNVISSGASLASGVTAGSFLADDGDDRSENRSDTVASDSGNPVTREIDEDEDGTREGDRHASQQSTPTQGSRPRVTVGENGTLESILLNPTIGESGLQGLSVRATRGPHDNDGNSSLATSVTNSTVITSTTRGDISTINVRRFLPEEQSLPEMDIHTPSRRGRSNFPDDTINSRGEPRSRSQSPLTIATHASETLSMASASTVGTSIRSSVAVAPRSVFGRRPIPTSNSLAGASESRPLPDRVVSFTPDLTSFPAPASAYSVEAADSITMPDELDNISEVADTFATNANAWREEYEARLDALHKRWSNE